jgi:hypothetical protein
MSRTGAIIDDQDKTNIFAIEPQVYVMEEAQTGFTPYAELINGRLAMIGFISLVALEVFTGHGVIGLLSSL